MFSAWRFRRARRWFFVVFERNVLCTDHKRVLYEKIIPLRRRAECTMYIVVQSAQSGSIRFRIIDPDWNKLAVIN